MLFDYIILSQQIVLFRRWIDYYNGAPLQMKSNILPCGIEKEEASSSHWTNIIAQYDVATHEYCKTKLVDKTSR